MLKVADLFAGIGGIRLGFERVFDDVECVFSSEIDKFAIQTYKANFNETPSGDITKIKCYLQPCQVHILKMPFCRFYFVHRICN